MTYEAPSPKTTLVILLGASAWPRLPELDASNAFTNAADDLKAYFLDPGGFNLPQTNLLDLFDSDLYADAIDEEIAQFLDKHIIEKEKSVDDVAKDVLVYFIGHGGISEGDSDFYLAIRRTRKGSPKGSSIEIGNLAKTLKDRARFQRRIVILDCCFAASAVRFFQGSGPMDVIRTKTIEVFEEQDKGVGSPSRGTALLCSSSSKVRSRILPDETYTLFTQALLYTLRSGNSFQQDSLSLRTVYRLTQDYLRRAYGDEAPSPEIHSPDQVEGDVASVPFFPNVARKTQEALQSRGRLAQDDIVAFLHHASGQLRQKRLPEELVGRLDLLAAQVYQPCVVAVVGHVKAGKSTFINALLREDLAPIGVTETTATINYFRSGIPDPQLPVRCYWRSGRVSDESRQFLASLQGHGVETLRMAAGIDHLEYLVQNHYLEQTILIDTPPAAITVVHHNRTSEFLDLTRQLRERHDQDARHLRRDIDAIIYLISAAPRFTDQKLVEEFHELTQGQAKAYNAVGVMAKIDLYPEIIERRTDLAAKIASQLKGKLNTVVPVSAGIRRALDVLLANNRAGLKRLVAAVRTIKQEEFDYLFAAAELYLEMDSDWPTEQRRELLGNMPWAVFKTIARIAADPGLDLDEVSKRLNVMTGFEQLQEVLEQHIFNRSVILRCHRILRDARMTLQTIKDECFPHKPGETITEELERELETRFFQLDQYDLVLDNSDFEALRLVLDNSNLFSLAEQDELRPLLGLYGAKIEERLPYQKSREYIIARQRYWIQKSIMATNAHLRVVANQAAFRYGLILAGI